MKLKAYIPGRLIISRAEPQSPLTDLPFKISVTFVQIGIKRISFNFSYIPEAGTLRRENSKICTAHDFSPLRLSLISFLMVR